MLALQQMRNAACEFDHFHAAGDFAFRIRQHFAVFGGDDRGEIACVAFQEFLELEHHPRAIERRGVGPCGECGGCGIDGGVDVMGGRERNALRDRTGGRIEDL